MGGRALYTKRGIWVSVMYFSFEMDNGSGFNDAIGRYLAGSQLTFQGEFRGWFQGWFELTIDGAPLEVLHRFQSAFRSKSLSTIRSPLLLLLFRGRDCRRAYAGTKRKSREEKPCNTPTRGIAGSIGDTVIWSHFAHRTGVWIWALPGTARQC
jgi:hypothetical protein